MLLFPFIRLEIIVISLGAMRISGVILGFLNFSMDFSQEKLIKQDSFYHTFLPILVLFSRVDIMSIRARPSGTTLPARTLRASRNLLWNSTSSDYWSLVQANWASLTSLVEFFHINLPKNFSNLWLC